MGGIGCGRWGGRRRSRGRCEWHWLRIEVSDLQKHGLLTPGAKGSLSWSRGDEKTGPIGVAAEDGSIRLRYASHRPGEKPEPVNELVRVVFADMHLGGRRPWFECPWCIRRCATLYGGLKFRKFRCRVCHDLTYSTQHVDWCGRLQTRLRKMRKRLGGSEDLFVEPFPPKPRGMHWSTYDRLQEKHDRLEHALNLHLDARLFRATEILQRRVERFKAGCRAHKRGRRRQ